MKSYHLHQKQTRKGKNHKAKNRKQNAQRNKKNANQKVAVTDKLKHLKTKQQKNNNPVENEKKEDLVNINATLSIKEMDDLNNYIHEYLIFHGYDKTIYEFEKERISNSYMQIKLKHNLMNPNIVDDDAMRNEILHKITAMFDANDIDGIFKLWNRYLSKDILTVNAYAIKLECHLHIYKFVKQFTQYTNTHDNDQMDEYIQNINRIRSELQAYFNDNGHYLSKCQDVLPYFSLPYVDNAHTHPIFAQFFEPDFAQNLRYIHYIFYMFRE